MSIKDDMLRALKQDAKYVQILSASQDAQKIDAFITSYVSHIAAHLDEFNQKMSDPEINKAVFEALRDKK